MDGRSAYIHSACLPNFETVSHTTSAGAEMTMDILAATGAKAMPMAAAKWAKLIWQADMVSLATCKLRSNRIRQAETMQADVAALKAHRCNRPSCRGPSCAALLKACQAITSTCAVSMRAAWDVGKRPARYQCLRLCRPGAHPDSRCFRHCRCSRGVRCIGPEGMQAAGKRNCARGAMGQSGALSG